MQVFKNSSHIIQMMTKCRESKNMDERVQLLQSINCLLPMGYKIKIPSFVTNDYIDTALSVLEEELDSYN
jgi:hypothetical protein